MFCIVFFKGEFYDGGDIFQYFPHFQPTEIQLFLIEILVFYKKYILTDPKEMIKL